MKSLKISPQAKHALRAIPNLLTICNSLCGFLAIVWTLCAYELHGDTPEVLRVFCFSAAMIFSAMIFDALDGLAARLLDAASIKGIQMDSLSDMVTFGVAPATLVAIMANIFNTWSLISSWQGLLVFLLCSVYIGCAALRLATYNVHAMDEEHRGNPNYFSGLPSPGAAAALCVVILFAYQHADWNWKTLSTLLPIYAAVLGLLMVSRIPYIHAGRWLFGVRRRRRDFLFFVFLLVIIAIFRLNGLVAIVTGYIVSGPVIALVKLFATKTASTK